MACSYHFTKEFGPTNSAIKTFRENSTGEIKIVIDSKCDSCSGEIEILCTKYCISRAIQIK